MHDPILASENPPPATVIPGEVITTPGDRELNAGRASLTLFRRCNTGDRPIQVGSHFHFAETNLGAGFRARQSARLPPQHPRRHRGALRAGPDREVTLVAYAGDRKVFGFNGAVMGDLGD